MYNISLTLDSNSDIVSDPVTKSAGNGNMASEDAKEVHPPLHDSANNYSSVDSATCSTAEESNNDMDAPDVSQNQKKNAFGEVKTSRYSHREKPPLPKIKYRRKKGSVKPTRFSQRIVEKRKRPADQVCQLICSLCMS